MEKKDYKGAVVHFKSALQLDPEWLEGRLLLGEALLAAGDPIGAVVELTKALKATDLADKVVPLLAKALIVNGEEKRLVDLFSETKLNNHVAQAALKSRVASAWLGLRDFAKADAAIAAALAAVPDYGPALTLAARRLGEQGRSDAALTQIDKVLARDATLHEAWALKGEIAVAKRQDPKTAEEAFRKALAIDPMYVPAHLAIIALRLTASDLPGAKEQAERLRGVMPKHPQTMFVDAQLAYLGKDFVKARELVQLLIRLSPENLGILQLAGSVEGQLGSLVLAETFFNKALAINPGLTLPRLNLARIYLRLGQPTRVLSVLKPLLATDAPSADAQALAGEAYLKLGDTKAAEAAFKRAAAINPDDQRTGTLRALSLLSKGDTAMGFTELAALSAKSNETYADRAILSAHLQRGELDGALAAAKTILKKTPQEASAYEALGRVQLAKRDFPAARTAYEQAAKLDPALFSAVGALAGIDVIEKKPEQARKRLEERIKSDPNSPYARQALAELRRRSGAPMAEVVALLDDAIRLAPTEVEPRLQRVELALKARQFKDALAVAQNAASAMPNDARVLEVLGRAQMEAGGVEQAINTYRRLIGLDPKSVLPYTRLADVYVAAGKNKDAEVILKKVLDLDPELVPAQAALLRLLMKTNQDKEALAFAMGVQKDRPGSDAGYVLEAGFHVNAKAPDAAVAALRKGLARNPDSSGLALELYKLFRSLKRTQETDQFAQAWLKANPKDIVFEYQTSNTALQRGDFAQAEVILQSVLSRFPNHPLALNNMAMVLVATGKPGALAYAQKAVDAMPEQPAIMDTLAMALAADNQTREALAVQKRAVELAPRNDYLRLNLAKIALKADDKTLARTELERLKALGARFDLQDEVAQLMKSL